MEKIKDLKQLSTVLELESNEWDTVEEVDDNSLFITTRQHGDVYNEEPGELDLKRFSTLAKKLKCKFNNIDTEVDYIDEWSILKVSIRKEISNVES